eukprot:jgi/Mesvir1/25319/Mv20385-RA.1
MLLIRRFEEKCGQFYGMGLIGGFCHLYIGQEAVIMGFEFAKQKGDSMITSYRDHAHIIMSGIDPKFVMAELTGRASGCSKGKGGSMHMFDIPGKFYGGHGIVGAQVPIGTGLAFAEKYNNTKNICYTFLGDGAVNQGQVYEAFNMASLWKLPVVYVIENNEYSMGTAVKRSTSMVELYKKGESFGIAGIQVNGMDVDAVYNAAVFASDYARSGAGPIIVEVKTYRFRGHSMSDPAKYRTKEEVEQYKGRDPLADVRNIIVDNKYASEEDLKTIEKKGAYMAEITVREALQLAMKEEMQRDERVFILGEEVAEYQGAYKITQGLLQEFGPKRVIDSPISEHGFTGLAIGAAFGGLRPIVEFMTFNFAMQAFDQIVNSAAKTNYMSGGQLGCPIVFRGPNGAAARVAAQHSQNFAAVYSHIPGLKVIAPYSAEDAKGLLISAIRDDNPVIFLENEIMYGRSFEIPDVIEPIPIGKARIVKEGGDVTILAFSLQVGMAIEAANILAEENIDAEIIDLRTIKPLDIETILESVRKTNRLISVEEGWFFAGIGATISSIVIREAFDYLDAAPEVVSGKDVPLPYAENLEKMSLPTVEEIIAAAKRACYR